MNTHQTYIDNEFQCKYDIPRDVMEANMTCQPKVIFETACEHYDPVIVGRAKETAYSNAPILGVIERIPYKGVVVFDGFCINYYPPSTSVIQTRFLGLDDLVSMQFCCMSSDLLEELKIIAERNNIAFDYDKHKANVQAAVAATQRVVM